ncbi:hypothetical protein CSA56_01435 [candidate division KSB3 bacterium]|uniref:Spermidine synthase n=1 Tax=candidate division KSB3 bacterium TaxID=2044937 RepID=A0A2G6KKC0_9BACT|nr:MAG: hypothetical protein CSA56_01435 [candidate division KSB3 bacterium]
MKRSKSKIAIGVIDTLLVLCFAIICFIHFVTPIRFESGGITFRATGFTNPFLFMALLWGLRYLVLILSKPKIGDNRMTWYYLGIGAVAGSSLLLEIAMTRVFAVAFFNHYAFLIISTAMFGFGLSGVVLAIVPAIRRFDFDKLLAVLSICFSLSVIVTLKIVVDVPLQFGNIKEQGIQILYLSVYFIALAIPFFFSGMVVALLLSHIAGKVNRLYFSDLLGAGIGCFLVLPIIPALGAPGAVIFAAMLGLIGAACFAKLVGRSMVAVCAVLFIAAALLLPLRGSHFRVKVHEAKRSFNMHEMEGDIELTRWGPISRIDVARFGPDKIIWIDGGSNQSFMKPFNGDLDALQPNWLAGLVYALVDSPDVLVVGPSAGEEVLYALSHKPNSITGVELDPVICDIMQNEYRQFSGGIYTIPGKTKLINDEGRSYIRRSPDKYDIIQQVNNSSPAAIASGAVNISETYLITVEAFHEYLDHLKDNGYVFIRRYGAIRLASVAAQALRERGIENPEERIIVMEDDLHQVAGGQFYLKNGEFTEDDLNLFRKEGIFNRVMYGPKALNVQHPKYQEYRRLIAEPDAWKDYDKIGISMGPVTDDKPFFNHFTKFARFSEDTVPEEFAPIFKAHGRSDFSLIMILIEAAVLSLVFIILPLWVFKRNGLHVQSKYQFLLYFFCLGLAFILIEIVFIQKFTLFMGNPTYSVTVVLFSLLVAAGCGSFLSGRLKEDPKKSLTFVIPAIVILCWFELTFGPAVFKMFLGHPMAVRMLLSILMLFPVGMVMGMPFPLGITLTNQVAPRLIPWGWGINGYATVIGSVSCVILALSFGFKAVIWIACGIYLLGLVAILNVKE